LEWARAFRYSGNHLAYGAMRGKMVRREDGVPGPEWEAIIGSTIRFNTRDSLIYSALKGGKLVVVRTASQGPRRLELGVNIRF